MASLTAISEDPSDKDSPESILNTFILKRSACLFPEIWSFEEYRWKLNRRNYVNKTLSCRNCIFQLNSINIVILWKLPLFMIFRFFPTFSQRKVWAWSGGGWKSFSSSPQSAAAREPSQPGAATAAPQHTFPQNFRTFSFIFTNSTFILCKLVSNISKLN